MARRKLGEILISAGVLDERRLETALSEQRRWGGPLGRILVEMKLVSEDVLVQALSHQLSFPIADLENVQIPDHVIKLVSGEFAEHNSVVPFRVDGKFLDVAMADPTNLGVIDELRIRTQLNIRPHLAGPRSIERAVARFYRRGVVTFGARSSGDAPASTQAFHDGMRVIELGDKGASGSHPGGEPLMRRPRARHNTELRDAEIEALQARISKLEALVGRDEDVIRKLLALLVDKGVASREEILDRIR